MRTLVSLSILVALPASALARQPPSQSPTAKAKPGRPLLQVSSPAFAANHAIPPKYTCDGTQTVPPLAWSSVPAGTQSIAILVENSDAPSGQFTHWLVTGISPTTTALPEGGTLPEGALAGPNSKGRMGYTGPCPPSGRHRYYFRVFALDTQIRSPRNKAEFISEIDGHVLAEGELLATYQKITPP